MSGQRYWKPNRQTSITKTVDKSTDLHILSVRTVTEGSQHASNDLQIQCKSASHCRPYGLCQRQLERLPHVARENETHTAALYHLCVASTLTHTHAHAPRCKYVTGSSHLCALRTHTAMFSALAFCFTQNRKEKLSCFFAVFSPHCLRPSLW